MRWLPFLLLFLVANVHGNVADKKLMELLKKADKETSPVVRKRLLAKAAIYYDVADNPPSVLRIKDHFTSADLSLARRVIKERRKQTARSFREAHEKAGVFEPTNMGKVAVKVIAQRSIKKSRLAESIVKGPDERKTFSYPGLSRVQYDTGTADFRSPVRLASVRPTGILPFFMWQYKPTGGGFSYPSYRTKPLGIVYKTVKDEMTGIQYMTFEKADTSERDFPLFNQRKNAELVKSSVTNLVALSRMWAKGQRSMISDAVAFYDKTDPEIIGFTKQAPNFLYSAVSKHGLFYPGSNVLYYPVSFYSPIHQSVLRYAYEKGYWIIVALDGPQGVPVTEVLRIIAPFKNRIVFVTVGDMAQSNVRSNQPAFDKNPNLAGIEAFKNAGIPVYVTLRYLKFTFNEYLSRFDFQYDGYVLQNLEMGARFDRIAEVFPNHLPPEAPKNLPIVFLSRPRNLSLERAVSAKETASEGYNVQGLIILER